ncbi:MAG: FtsB family cell division protein [Bacillota bacterium]
MKSQKHNRPSPRKSKRWGMIAFVVIAFFVVFHFAGRYLQYNNMQHELSRYQEQLAETEKKYQDLQEQKALLYDDSYLETLARATLGMVKEGEVLVSPMQQNDEVKEQDRVDKNNIH